jgi:hypothetical protein
MFLIPKLPNFTVDQGANLSCRACVFTMGMIPSLELIPTTAIDHDKPSPTSRTRLLRHGGNRGAILLDRDNEHGDLRPPVLFGGHYSRRSP